MNIDLKKATKAVGETFKVSSSLDLGKDILQDITLKKPFSFDISYKYDNFHGEDLLTISGEGKLEAKANCYRCDKQVSIKQVIDLSEKIYLKDKDYNIVDDKFPLEDYIVEKILFNKEGKILCKKSCKGLCPTCGANLNTGKCECEEVDDIDNPFYALKMSLKNDDK